MPTVNYGTWVSVRSNDSTSIAQRIGNLLRWAANAIDGRETMAVEILTIPAISAEHKGECINAGLIAMQAAAKGYTEAEALELVMREHYGMLYEQGQ